jgi:hypothetical protein
MGNKKIYLKNRNDSEFAGIFDDIENGNAELYNFLLAELRSPNVGIKEDVLYCIKDHAPDFGTDKAFLHCVVEFASNDRMTPDFLIWINSFIQKNRSYPVDDFDVAVSAAIDVNIPFVKIKDMFESGKYDETEILYAIQDYEPSGEDVAANETLSYQVDDAEPVESGEKDTSDYSKGYEGTVAPYYSAEKQAVSNKNDIDNSYNEMINSLITVMLPKNDGAAREIDNNLHSILAKFQLALTELQSYASEIKNELDKKDEEIKRQNALLKIQEKLITSHQNKINEQKAVIDELNAKIHTAERTEMQREAINQKINELQNLTIGVSGINRIETKF